MARRLSGFLLAWGAGRRGQRSGRCGAPLLLSGQADPGLVAAAASVGGNVLSEVLTDGVDQLRDHPDEMDAEQVQDWLEAQSTRVLESGELQATVLEAELALLLDEIGAVQAAVAEVVRLGDEETALRMRSGLAEMDEHLAAVGSRPEDLHLTVGEILRDVRLLLDCASPPASTPASGLAA
jgi:glycerol-3-phosphate dehydrogenase